LPTRIVVVSDTHHHRWDEVHPDIRRAVAEADIAVHCGDFVRQDVADGFRNTARRAVLVHGNTDPAELRQSLPYVETFQVEGVSIGAIHPAWGGPEFPPEDLLADFETTPDVILYGHLHVPMIERRGGVLFVNPGQGYPSFMTACTIATLTIDNGEIHAEIREIVPAG
jgi:hypothetical protein